MSIDESLFRQAMGRFASGVTVVTINHQGKLYGITVSAFCSLSLEPPLVLICIDKTAPSHRGLTQATSFAVNILSDRQVALSQHFAMRMPNKFAGVSYQLGATTGAPILEGALVTLECQLVNTLPGGDHDIFVGQVLNTQVNDGRPLLYYRSQYHGLHGELLASE